MFKNKAIKSYNVRKQFKTEEELNNFMKFSGEKSINIDYDENKSLSIFHEDYNIDLKNLVMEIRIKRFAQDNVTPRNYKIYDSVDKKETMIDVETLMNFYKKLGFEEFKKVYTLQDKLLLREKKLKEKENLSN